MDIEEKCVSLAKIAFGQFHFLGWTDLFFCVGGSKQNVWEAEKKISKTYAKLYIGHNEILLCIDSVVVNDPRH